MTAEEQVSAMSAYVLSAADRFIVEAEVARKLEDAHSALIAAMKAADGLPERELHRKVSFAALALDDAQRFLAGSVA